MPTHARSIATHGRPTGDIVEAVRRLCYPDVRELDQNRVYALRQYVAIVTLAHHAGARRILELGGGISTAMWARLGAATGAEVICVDASFDRMWTHVESMPERDLIRERVRLVEAGTVSAEQLRSFYGVEGHGSIGAVRIADLAPLMDAWISERCPWPMWRAACELAAPGPPSVARLLVQDGSLVFPRALLDRYALGGSLDANLDFLERLDREGRGDALASIVEREEPFDLVFFDGGELSTLLEWETLRGRIRPGGLAAFHDVFYPKSMKSFIACAAVEADPDWRTIYVDDSTMQGMVVAQRLR